MQATSWRVCTLSVVLLWALAGSASAHDPDEPAGAQADVKTAQPPGQAGMRAYFDPKTGTIGPPPPDQSNSPSTAVQHPYRSAGEGLVVVPAPGGGQMIDLQGRFQNAIIATLKPDGTVETECHPNGNVPPEAVGR